MVPLYVAALRMLTSADATEVRRWYSGHKRAAAMQLWMEQLHDLTAAASPTNATGSIPGAGASGSAKMITTSPVLSAPLVPLLSPPQQDNDAVKTFRDSPLVSRRAGATAAGATAEAGVGAPPPPLPAKPSVQPMELEVIDLP